MRTFLKINFFLIIICCLLQCKTKDTEFPMARSQKVKMVTKAYFQTFAERKDWEKLLSFYHDDLVFEDVISQKHTRGIEEFKAFYDWPNPGFKKLFPEQRHLEIEHIMVNDSMSVVHGHVNPFYWQGKLFEMEWGGKFTIWLFYDEELKITRQIDWFEYSGDVLISVGKRLLEGDY